LSALLIEWKFMSLFKQILALLPTPN